MPTEIIMPKWGMSMEEGKVARWLKQPGDTVEQGEELVEIETEKITNIVESPIKGTLAAISVSEGEMAPVQAVLALIAAPGEAVEAPTPTNGSPAATAPAAAPTETTLLPASTPATGNGKGARTSTGPVRAAPAARRVARELGVDLANVQPTGPRGMIVVEDVRRAAAAGPATQADAPPAPQREKVAATPVARRVARELGIDLANVQPTGPRGMIVVEDVRRAAEAGPATVAATTATPGSAEQTHQAERAGAVKRVGFYYDSSRIAGMISLPQDLKPNEQRPAIVFCVGYTYLKEMVVPEMARWTTRHGYVGLTFDYRGFGESEGRHGRLMPSEQVADVRSAVTFLSQQPEVDPARIAVVGLSLGGSNAVATAAIDNRVQAAVAIESPANGERWLGSLRRYSEWLDFKAQLAADRVARTLQGEGRSIDALEIMLPDPGSAQFLEQVYTEFPQMRTQLTLESAEALLDYKPEYLAPQLGDRGLLVVHGSDDRLVPVSEAQALHQAATNSHLVVVPGMDHFNWVFPSHAIFEQVMTAITDWLDAQL